jgi:hypothetical protein
VRLPRTRPRPCRGRCVVPPAAGLGSRKRAPAQSQPPRATVGAAAPPSSPPARRAPVPHSPPGAPPARPHRPPPPPGSCVASKSNLTTPPFRSPRSQSSSGSRCVAANTARRPGAPLGAATPAALPFPPSGRHFHFRCSPTLSRQMLAPPPLSQPRLLPSPPSPHPAAPHPAASQLSEKYTMDGVTCPVRRRDLRGAREACCRKGAEPAGQGPAARGFPSSHGWRKLWLGSESGTPTQRRPPSASQCLPPRPAPRAPRPAPRAPRPAPRRRLQAACTDGCG